MTNFQWPRSSVKKLLVCSLGAGLLLPLSWAADAPPAKANDDAKPAALSTVKGPFATGGNIEISKADMDAESQRVPAQVRPVTVIDPASLEIMVKNLYLRRALTKDAEAARLEQDPQVAAALRLARERVLSEAWVERAENAAVPDEAALETYARTAYKAESKRFAEPEQWKASHILIAVKKPEDEADAKERAQKLLEALQGGADFATLAREKSEDPGSGAKGGDLGYFPKGRMVKPFEDAVVALAKPGDLSGLVRSQFGFHIIRLDEHQPARTRPYEEVREQLLAETQRKIRTEARQRLIDTGMKNAQVNAAAIEALAAENKAAQPSIPLSGASR